jgi:hypothetical protein
MRRQAVRSCATSSASRTARKPFFANAALLDRLAGEKLERIGETVRAEGWKWVAVIPDLSWEEQRKYAQRNVRSTYTDEEKTEAAKLRKQIAVIEKEYPEEFERPDETSSSRNWRTDSTPPSAGPSNGLLRTRNCPEPS